MLNLNCTILAAVVEQALVDASGHPRWISAIRRAFEEVDSNPWIERGELHGLTIGSPSSKLYSANGTCQCTAYEFGRPCWHRAAARLVRLHDEAIERQQQIVCQQPDNFCSVHEPCAEHADQAAAYLAQEGAAIAAAESAGLLTMPEGDTLDTDGMRVARKIAAARATARINELFA
jgi:SWIM zinc finger